MDRRIVHETPIPVAGREFAYEYELPLAGIPAEVDAEWTDWLGEYVKGDANEVHRRVRNRFRGLGSELARLGELVGEYRPFSLLVYGGTPLLWLKKTPTDFIYLPPEGDPKEVAAALRPFRLESHALLIEFLANFGGMGERWPWEAVEFGGSRSHGKTILEPAVDDLEAGREYRTEAEFQERRRRFAPWLDGATLLFGDDGHLWHIGPNGTICLHECGESDVYGTFESLSEFIRAFLEAVRPEGLFRSVRDGF